ncbi:hypothetical protein NA57DRAFT_31656 [Rhizodiscina lignyota]|uniref:Integral membrane protein n=1 Tax=Rhizodiscina lignyota TaxID=1504668 RepID=A0A9P4IN28_9PEZI|nr:hypothetical protein NA57DRAFT_31656 [Rhizodiscina lignyota]
MGKGGRVLCIALPMILTIASLVCLVFVFLGSRDAKNGTTSEFYFWRADTSNFTSNPNVKIGGHNISGLITAIDGTASANNLSDFYQVGLWDYCSGKNDSGDDKVTFCSKPQSSYFFNLTEVWNLQNTSAEEAFPKTLKDGLKAYQKGAHWMFVIYVIALAVTAGEIVVGFFAIFSRWGSCVTTIVSAASTLFTILAAITSTVITSIVVGAFEASFKAYGIKTSFGTKMLAVVWLAVAFSLVSGVFWTLSTCCCSGQSGAKRDGGIRRSGTLVERTPYTHEYKPVGEPVFGQQPAYGQPGHGQAMPMHTMTGAQSHARHQSQGFEPYRNV